MVRPTAAAVLRRYLPVVLSAVVLTAVVGYVLSGLQAKTYEATSRFYLDSRGSQSLPAVQNDPHQVITTIADLLTSKLVLDPVAQATSVDVDQLTNDVSATPELGSSVVTLLVMGRSPQEAVDLSRAIEQSYVRLATDAPPSSVPDVGSLSPTGVSFYSAPVLPLVPKAPVPERTALLAGLVGGLLTFSFFWARALLRPTTRFREATRQTSGAQVVVRVSRRRWDRAATRLADALLAEAAGDVVLVGPMDGGSMPADFLLAVVRSMTARGEPVGVVDMTQGQSLSGLAGMSRAGLPNENSGLPPAVLDHGQSPGNGPLFVLSASAAVGAGVREDVGPQVAEALRLLSQQGCTVLLCVSDVGSRRAGRLAAHAQWCIGSIPPSRPLSTVAKAARHRAADAPVLGVIVCRDRRAKDGRRVELPSGDGWSSASPETDHEREAASERVPAPVAPVPASHAPSPEVTAPGPPAPAQVVRRAKPAPRRQPLHDAATDAAPPQA